MKKLLLLLIFTIQIAFAHSIFGQAKPTVLRLDPPSFIPVKNNFQTSLVFKFEEKNENLEINIQKPKNIEILSASIKLGDKTKEINFKNIDNAHNQIKILLNTNLLSLEENKFYQIIFTCYSSDPLKLKKDSFSWLDKNIFDDALFIEKSEIDDESCKYTNPKKLQGKVLNSINHLDLI